MSIVGPFKLKAQLMCGTEPAMGPGKLGMSYRRIWLLVDGMNRCWDERLVETTKGGGDKGGAELTARGRAILQAFRSLEARLERAVISGDNTALFEGLRLEARPRSA